MQNTATNNARARWLEIWSRARGMARHADDPGICAESTAFRWLGEDLEDPSALTGDYDAFWRFVRLRTVQNDRARALRHVARCRRLGDTWTACVYLASAHQMQAHDLPA